MRKLAFLSVLLLLVAGLMVSGCTNMKGKTETALQTAEKLINDARPEAEKIVPDVVKGLDDMLAAAKDKFGKGDYAGALADAQGIPAKVTEMTSSLAAKKEELTAGWTALEQGMPMMMDAIKGKLDAFAKMKKLPANVTKESVAQAKTGYETAATDWEAVKTSFAAGNLAEAVTKGTSLKDQVGQLMQTLGIPAPTTP